jgi:Holliday junction resolvasome RuvABC endonuclease subunit
VTHIAGIDPSIASTGIARITDTARLTSETVASTGKRSDTLVDRDRRLTGMATRILDAAGQAHLAVIEGLIVTPGGSPLDRHALWWLIVGGLIRREIPVAVVHPTTLKLAIGGHGRADKVAVAMAIGKLYPNDADEVTGNDVADAAGLAHLGAVRLAWNVETLERHRTPKWTEWPTFGIDDTETEPSAAVRSRSPRASAQKRKPSDPFSGPEPARPVGDSGNPVRVSDALSQPGGPADSEAPVPCLSLEFGQKPANVPRMPPCGCKTGCYHADRTPGPRRGPAPARPPRTTGDATATPADVAAAGYPFAPDYTEADL